MPTSICCSMSKALGNSDVLPAVEAQVEGDVDKVLLIDIVQDEQVAKDVSRDLEDDHEIFVVPPSPSQFQIHDVMEADGDQVDGLEGRGELGEDDDVELDHGVQGYDVEEVVDEDVDEVEGLSLMMIWK